MAADNTDDKAMIHELRQSFSFLFTAFMGMLATQKAMIAALRQVEGFPESFAREIRGYEKSLEQARKTLLRSLERHLESSSQSSTMLKELLVELARKSY